MGLPRPLVYVGHTTAPFLEFSKGLSHLLPLVWRRRRPCICRQHLLGARIAVLAPVIIRQPPRSPPPMRWRAQLTLSAE
jgi:hypothetical protein